jgi:hypothetical protein
MTVMKLTLKRGATIFDPIPVGVRADGEIASIQIAGPSGGIHCLISGMSGSGKTYGQKPVLITAAALQCDQILIDPMKGTQSYQSIAGCLQMYEVDFGRCKQMVKRLLSHVIPARTNHLAREGLGEWAPRSTLRFLRVQIEEGWRLANTEALIGLGNATRSAGMQIDFSLQQPTFDQMPTALRNQMGAFRCYGLADNDYAQYSLPENVVAAGARPAQWGNEDPGMHYLVSHGMTIREKVLSTRAFSDGSGENTFAAAASRVAANLGPMCPVTVEALGDLWDTRLAPLDLVKSTGIVVVTADTGAALERAAAEVGATQEYDEGDGEGVEIDGLTEDDFDEDDFDVLDDFTWDLSEDGTEITITCSDGDDFTITLGPDEDELDDPEVYTGYDEEMAPDIKRLIGDPPKDGLSPEEFREIIETRVQAFLAGDDQFLSRTRFVNVAADSGWAPSTVYKYLDRHPQLEKADPGFGYVRVGDPAARQQVAS